MENHNRNQPEALPYQKLALLGIDKEKADKLPQEVKEKLISGEVTPLLQVSINARNGDVITLPLKLQMVADKLLPRTSALSRQYTMHALSPRPRVEMSLAYSSLDSPEGAKYTRETRFFTN